jgi:hypothetical protein
MEEQPSYELEVEQRGWRKALAWFKTVRGVVLTTLIIVLLVCTWKAPAIYRAAKVWRAERLIARCEAAALRGDEAEEERCLRQAFALVPTHPATWRAFAHFQERRGEVMALAAYDKVLASGKATVDDAERASRLVALHGNLELGQRILDGVQRDPVASKLPAVLSLQARLLALKGNWEPALALAQKAVEQAPEAAPEQLALATLLLQAADRAGVDQRAALAARAVSLLSKLALRSDDSSVEALTLLINLAQQPAAAQLLAGYDVAAWVEAAERHPKASPRLRVMAWNLQMAGKAADPEKFFALFLEKWRDSPLPQRLEAARWLNQNGRPRLSLELSTEQKNVSADWFLAHLDALAATGQWSVVLEHLAAKTGQAAAMPGALRALFQFRARSELRQPLDAAELWRDIQIQLQTESVRNQLYIAQYAEKTRELRQAALIYRRLLQDAAKPASFDRTLPREAKFACYTGLIRCLPPTVPVAEVLPWFDALTADFPELEEARNDALYLRLLTGESAPRMRAELAPLLQRNGALLAYRTTAALLELRLGNPAAADQLYTGWKIDWSSASDRFKAVRAAVAEAAGHPEEAQSLRETIDEGNLRPEEIALLKTH